MMNILSTTAKFCEKILPRLILTNVAVLFTIKAQHLHFKIANNVVKKSTLLNLESSQLTEFFEKIMLGKHQLIILTLVFLLLIIFLFSIISYFNKGLELELHWYSFTVLFITFLSGSLILLFNYGIYESFLNYLIGLR